ncbi:MAG: hypothetical protein F9K24_20600 [Leptonema illini]|uniref:Uncharacterized protein n=1 Tax=Leptonema illini TaxID=183 RepID=A0A833GXI9_9LEPT|nr:MAG: hypothetical protein F9K24_20600 [Leptonema illini]
MPYLATAIDIARLCIKFKTISISAIKTFFLYELFMDSPLDQLLASATIKGKEDKRYDNLIRIDLQDRRFYVGEIYAMGEPTETEGAVSGAITASTQPTGNPCLSISTAKAPPSRIQLRRRERS